MPAVTPHFAAHQGLASLASRLVAVDELPWRPTRFPGIACKILMEDKERGLLAFIRS